MKKYLLISIFILIYVPVNSQNQNSIWMFGDSAGIDFGNINNPIPIHSAVKSRGSCTSIADKNGNILFYAYTFATAPGNTGIIKNKDHNLMQNGDSIIGQGWYNEVTIVPHPYYNNLFYLFSISVTSGTIPGLYYSLIDMLQDSGRGAVLQKNIQLTTWEATDCLLAIKHGNGKDWWLIARESSYSQGSSNNNWFVFLIDSIGIHALPIQSIGALNSTNLGNLAFDPIYNKLIFTNYWGLVEEYDFDRCTGIISNPINIQQENGQVISIWGSAISPSGQFLYVSTNNNISFLYQYDLFATNIQASRVTIDSFSVIAGAGGLLRIAPDDKIYYSRSWYDGFNFNFPYPDTAYNIYNMYLSVINEPDQPGLACNFTPFSFYLGCKRTYYGLPNNPDYELGPLAGSMCDTIVGVSEPDPPPKDEFYFYPNPAKDEIKINYACKSNCVVEIIDITGRIVLNKIINEKLISLQKIPGGTYYIALKEDNKTVARDLIQIIK